jgi:hypothetical protein
LSANVAEISGASWTLSSHGVRQVPAEVLTSAPGGFDSNRTVCVRAVSVDGDELKKFKLGVDAEHAATVKLHAITAMTRLISDPPVGQPTPPTPREPSGERDPAVRWS